MAVLKVWAFTVYESQIFFSFISAISPVFPSMPIQAFSPFACLPRNAVIVLITFTPQFCANVRGMASKAKAAASYGHFSMPSMEELFCFKVADTVSSVAPPPGTSFGFFIIFLATHIASCRFLSTSFKRSLLAPRNNIVQAFGSLQSTINAKNSSPIFLTSKSPAPVPTSDSCSSSGLFTMTAPHALAILLLSVFLTLLIALTPALLK
uniref:Uncharacterized protein n=1 Tax=Opuntia streptacantha TaxID=393608 RepID=A0A7C9CJN7_OPUST